MHAVIEAVNQVLAWDLPDGAVSAALAGLLAGSDPD
jgi:hypothetical protein